MVLEGHPDTEAMEMFETEAIFDTMPERAGECIESAIYTGHRLNKTYCTRIAFYSIQRTIPQVLAELVAQGSEPAHATM